LLRIKDVDGRDKPGHVDAPTIVEHQCQYGG
jgi:hypothetical protein